MFDLMHKFAARKNIVFPEKTAAAFRCLEV